MQTAILTLHVIVCIILVVLVLLQSGREGMGVIFGGGGNSSVFGSAGAGYIPENFMPLAIAAMASNALTLGFALLYPKIRLK